MKLTRHNGRANKDGVYTTAHNDRSFDVENSDHIDNERVQQNIYWDCINGYYQHQSGEDRKEVTFDDAEDIFYCSRYADFVKGQNARNEKNRHPERNRSAVELRLNKKTCPEETIFQIGTMEDHASPETLLRIVNDFLQEMEKRFGQNVHILDWALHMDEATPHIHERHVFDCENKYGEIAPQQEKALEKLGFDLPHPDQPIGRHNNRKMTFDSACRVMLFDICKKYGLHLDEEPEYGGRAYLEKQDFILMKQREQMKAQQEEIRTNEDRLETLTIKVNQMENLVEDVADAAYNKAVEVVTDAVAAQVHQEDIQLIRGTQEWLKSPNRKAPEKERLYAINRLEGVITKITNAMSNTLQKVMTLLKHPSISNAAKDEIKTAARTSLRSLLADAKVQADEANAARREQQKRTKQQQRREQ